MSTAFIAGATGYTGRHVTERLARLGVRTVAHVRSDSSALGAWTARFAAADATGKAAGYEAVDYGLTALLLRTLRAANVHPRFIYLSSMGASAASGLPYLIVRPSFISGSDRDERRVAKRVASIATDAVLKVAAAQGAPS